MKREKNNPRMNWLVVIFVMNYFTKANNETLFACVCLTNKQSQICEIRIENLSGRGRKSARLSSVLQKPSWSEVRRMCECVCVCLCVNMGHVFSALLPRLCTSNFAAGASNRLGSHIEIDGALLLV